jgi:hypothetical protein
MYDPVFAESVRRAMRTISPCVTDAAQIHGWPAALDAVGTILMATLIAAIGGDEARTACGRMYQEVARLEGAGTPFVELGADIGEPRGRA